MTLLRRSTCGLPAALALLTLAACASGPQAPAQPQSQDRGEYVTGSNIPRRDGRAANRVNTMEAGDLQKAGSAPAR